MEILRSVASLDLDTSILLQEKYYSMVPVAWSYDKLFPILTIFPFYSQDRTLWRKEI